jgi:hypothetical protein
MDAVGLTFENPVKVDEFSGPGHSGLPSIGATAAWKGGSALQKNHG